MHYLVNRRKHFRTASSTWTANNETISAYDSYLKAYYKLEDTADSAGTHTLTNVGSISFATSGKRGNCATLNGSSQYLTAAASADFHPAAGDWMAVLWFKLASTSGYQGFFGGAFQGLNRSWELLKHNAGTYFQFGYSTDGTAVTWVKPNWSADTNWNFVCVGRAGSTLKFYINAGSIGAYDIGTDEFFSQADDPYYLGSTSNAEYFNGNIDEHGFWKGMSFVDVAAMDTLVSALYNSGTGAFLI